MIKGVNKRIVEIQNPDSLYFDKAVFYLKPNLAELSPRILTLEANNCLRTYSPRRLRTHRVLRAVLVALSILMIAAVGFLCGARLHLVI